jgi:hypothetical protein
MDQNKEKISYKDVCLISSLLSSQTLIQMETIYIPDITANGPRMIGLILALLNS